MVCRCGEMESVIFPSAAAVIPRVNAKDSRWLTLEVCPELLQGSCSRADEECRYAHPPSHVEIQNGRVTCCYDSIKGKCSRTNPPCKYLHPPMHLREQLLETGRQNLILKNLQVQSAAMASGLPPVLPMPSAMVPLVYENGAIRQVLPSNYQMIVSGQYPYMQPQVAHPYALQSSAGVPLQYLSTQQPGYQNRVIHMVNPQSATLPLQSLGTTPGASAQVLLSGVPGGGVYGQQMTALASSLGVGGQMELCYMPDGSYAYQAPSWSGTLGSSDTRQVVPASSASSSVVGSQYTEAAGVVSSLSDATSPSYSLASSIGMYPTAAVAYNQQATQLLETGSVSSSRKRTREALVGTNGASLVPVVKRPALVDSTSGLPVYQQFSTTPQYQQMVLAALPQQQQHYNPISLTSNHAILPHF